MARRALTTTETPLTTQQVEHPMAIKVVHVELQVNVKVNSNGETEMIPITIPIEIVLDR